MPWLQIIVRNPYWSARTSRRHLSSAPALNSRFRSGCPAMAVRKGSIAISICAEEINVDAFAVFPEFENDSSPSTKVALCFHEIIPVKGSQCYQNGGMVIALKGDVLKYHLRQAKRHHYRNVLRASQAASALPYRVSLARPCASCFRIGQALPSHPKRHRWHGSSTKCATGDMCLHGLVK